MGSSLAKSSRASDEGGILKAPKRIRRPSNAAQYHAAIIKQLGGAAGQRKRAGRRRIGSYEVLEVLFEDGQSGEYIGRRALLSDDQTRYRIRTWRLEPGLTPEEQEKRRQIISRPTEAVAKVGRHPNLLPVLQFDFVVDDNEFFEVTEWSDFGTLHGYLTNEEQEQLTLRERLLIAEGVVAALETVHANEVVHRNVSPESIVIDFEHKPLLTDFDRAYIESRQTVFADTDRKRNDAFIPPELKDPSAYDFDAVSDMYSFGALLYYLVTNEVPFADPDQALAAKGRPTKLPSEFLDSLEPGFDELVLELLNVEDFQARPGATQTVERLRRLVHNGSSAKAKGVSTSSKPKEPAAFEVGSTVDNVYRIDAKLGSGAFSNVFKVYHLDHQETYALKLLSKSEDADIILHEYNKVGKVLPRHPNIATVKWMARLSPPDGRPFILSEYIDGEELEPYCTGEKRLAWGDIRKIGGQLLDALGAMHPDAEALEAIETMREQMSGKSVTEEEWEEFNAKRWLVAEGILHRDIKPANILLALPSHNVKLIDFNIASTLGDATGHGGTPRYWAPDRGRPEWHPNMDLFSLGVVLYELVTQHHPFPDDNPEAGEPMDPREVRDDLHLSKELAEFFVKAVAPAGQDRFQTAKAMKAAWFAIPNMHAPAEPEPEAPTGRRCRLHGDSVGRRCNRRRL